MNDLKAKKGTKLIIVILAFLVFLVGILFYKFVENFNNYE